MKTLYKKELSYYLNNPIGYISLTIFAVLINFLFIKDIFSSGVVTMRSFFYLLPWLLSIFIPSLTMRMISEEKRLNTLEVLLSLPISETQIVLSKFKAILFLVVISLVLTLGFPISLVILSRLYWPELLVNYFGAILLSGFFIGLSLYFSSITKNQVIAFLTSLITLFLLTVIGSDFVSGTLPKFIIDFFSYFSPFYHFQYFIKGIIDLRSMVYFLTGTLVFVLLTINQLKRRD